MKKLKILLFIVILNFLFLSGVSANEFICKIGDYSITYDDTGKIISAKNSQGQEINKVLTSDFTPKRSTQCPTNEDAEIKHLDGGRTFHVASKYSDQTQYEKKQDLGSCAGYTQPSSCNNNNFYACIWNETEYGNYCNTDNLLYVACGESFDIPNRVPEITSLLVNLLKVGTPIILILVSVITLFKAITASKEDEIKKAQSSLIKKIIAAVMVFFIVSIVQFVISKVADSSEQGGIESCLSCFLNNDCENSVYYKTNVGGKYICTYIDGSGTFQCKGSK